MTRLLNVWYLIRPSCHLFCFLLRSWVKRQTNSRTRAELAWLGGGPAVDPEDMREDISNVHVVVREFVSLSHPLYRVAAWVLNWSLNWVVTFLLVSRHVFVDWAES